MEVGILGYKQGIGVDTVRVGGAWERLPLSQTVFRAGLVAGLSTWMV